MPFRAAGRVTTNRDVIGYTIFTPAIIYRTVMTPGVPHLQVATSTGYLIANFIVASERSRLRRRVSRFVFVDDLWLLEVKPPESKCVDSTLLSLAKPAIRWGPVRKYRQQEMSSCKLFCCS